MARMWQVVAGNGMGRPPKAANDELARIGSRARPPRLAHSNGLTGDDLDQSLFERACRRELLGDVDL